MLLRKSLNRNFLILSLLALLLIINYINVNGQLQATSDQEQMPRLLLSHEEAIQHAVKKIGPAVVTIKQAENLASGVIFSSRGYILTSYQVVKAKEQLKVKLANDQQYEARLIGVDQQTNLAVIKIKARNLPVADFGNSNDIELGQLAIVIGSPFNLEFNNTVTSGVISATNRKVETASEYHSNVVKGLIQTDASINPGNMGGPLLNSQGEVIGINIEHTQHMGFSLPINKVKQIVEELMEQGTVHRPWIGVYGTKLTSELVDHYNLPIKEGVMIFRVIIDSPAERAGLEKGDIIVEAGRKEVTTMEELNNIIRGQDIGSELKLLVHKKGGNWQVITTKTIKMPSKSID